jgi:hypothetical protein
MNIGSSESELGEARYPMSSAEFGRSSLGKQWMTKAQMTVHIHTMPVWGDQICDRLLLEHQRQTITRAAVGWEECPRTKRLHLQCFVEFPEKKRVRWIMEIFGAFSETCQSIPIGAHNSPWPHITRHKGRSIHGWLYTKKDCPTPYERPGSLGMWFHVGDEPPPSAGGQGKRSDLDAYVERIRENPSASIRELVEEGHGPVMMRYPQGSRMIQAAFQQRRERGDVVIVYWLYGEPGTGKSYSAYEMAIRDGATPDDIYYKMAGKWFCGYKGQKYMIIDDFRPDKQFTFTMLLRLIDRYRLRVERKGSSTYMNARFFYFTSVLRWDDERMIAYGNHEAISQLSRRITKTLYFRPRTAEEKGTNEYPEPTEDTRGPRAVHSAAPGFVVPPTHRPRDPVARTLDLVRTDTLSDSAQDTRNRRRRLF